ncbi:MAG: ATP synthase F0 subunit B [Firmicutes bacterium]|nr:ATP synthase F0 subunit B [Bacillota bacterium]
MQNLIFLAQAVPDGRVFGLDSQTLIQIGIQLLNAILLAAALGYLLYNPVKEFMQKRTDRIQKQMDDAEAAKARAEELIAEYKQKLSEIDREREEIFEAARLRAAEERKAIIAEAKQEALEQKQRVSESIAAQKERLKEEARLYIIEAASLMAEKYIAQTIDDQIQDKLFAEALAQLEEAQWLH